MIIISTGRRLKKGRRLAREPSLNLPFKTIGSHSYLLALEPFFPPTSQPLMNSYTCTLYIHCKKRDCDKAVQTVQYWIDAQFVTSWIYSNFNPSIYTQLLWLRYSKLWLNAWLCNSFKDPDNRRLPHIFNCPLSIMIMVYRIFDTFIVFWLLIRQGVWL